MIFCLVCIIVAVSSVTTCSAARGLPPSMRSDKIKASVEVSDINTSRPKDVAAHVDATTTTESDSDDWVELSEDEVDSCWEESEIGLEESASEYSGRPCHRMLGGDYGSGSPSPNKNKKGP